MNEGFFKVYFSHEFGGKQENIDHMDEILKALYSTIGEEMSSLSILPVSPLHSLGFAYAYVPYDIGMEMCFELLKDCSMMVTVDGFDDSLGVNLEKDFCKKHGIPIRNLDAFIDFVEERYKSIAKEYIDSLIRKDKPMRPTKKLMTGSGPTAIYDTVCGACGESLAEEHNYCPECGQSVDKDGWHV